MRAIYFDHESHVIHYILSFPAKQPAVVFSSEVSATSPGARLVYEAAEDGTLLVEFYVAVPGGELVSHVKGLLMKEG